ncbi:MAG: hypothetical protein KDB22_03205 [Planctomycetales bacterium]|nr:hypothetical protein [Planctomycetales bacterium]
MVRTLLVAVLVVQSATNITLADEPTEPNSPASFANSYDESNDVVSEAVIASKFEAELYQFIADQTSGCVDCHGSEATSSLVLTGNATSDFRLLLDGGYLNPHGPDTLVARLASENPRRRMPKDAPAWPRQRIERFEAIVSQLQVLQHVSGVKPDEQFPRALLEPYHQSASGAVGGNDQKRFLTFRQLKGKIAAQFDDDATRGDRDLFAEHIAAFGGADFTKRFNESTTPTASFLSAMEQLARELAQHAFRQRSGPFAGLELPQISPLSASIQATEFVDAITTLYQRVLFRKPTEKELSSSFELLCEIYRLEDELSQRSFQTAFELTVHDPESNVRSVQTVSFPVQGDRLSVRQFIVDQQQRKMGDEHVWVDRIFRPLVDQLSQRVLYVGNTNDAQGEFQLGQHVELKVHEQDQRIVVHNASSHRNVSFSGVEIRDQAGLLVSDIAVDSPGVALDGAWELETRDGFSSAEDRNRNKGSSTITVPLKVEKDGQYSVKIRWRASASNASNVVVELHAHNASNTMVNPQLLLPSEPGLAHFTYDCGIDTVPYRQIDGRFRFDDESYIEISNRGTIATVTAGAIELVRCSDEKAFVIDSSDAEGSDQWEAYDEGRFRAYNVKGKKLHDGNKDKGERSLRYRIRSLSSKAAENGWDPDATYNVRIYYPGKRDQETRVPVVIKSVRSAPIIQVAHPIVAKADASIQLDASRSYTTQDSRLEYTWRQLAGPVVSFQTTNTPRIEFAIPRTRIQQVAWSTLCAALLRHPDFLFVEPPSYATASVEDRERLLLVKLALDLLGRSPTRAEVTAWEQGQTIEQFVDQFLQSEEFKEFYFHRIRLYLESQGNPMQDEPARLWCHIAFEDRPFQEILTAEYTADEQFRRVERPKYHGKTGLLTTQGFIDGKPGLPHYNYAAQVSMLFLGYVYEVPPEIVDQREGVTALGTTDPDSVCYSCHKILTPLAFQRLNWTDSGEFVHSDASGNAIDASDRGAAADYPFPGEGMEAFAIQAAQKERFIRTIINTHVGFYFGRPLRFREDERMLYKQLWKNVHDHQFQIRELIRCIVTSDEYAQRLKSPRDDSVAQQSFKDGVDR